MLSFSSQGCEMLFAESFQSVKSAFLQKHVILIERPFKWQVQIVTDSLYHNVNFD